VPFHAARNPRSMADDDPLRACSRTIASYLRHPVCFHPNASPDVFDCRRLKCTLPGRHHPIITEDHDPATNRARHFIGKSNGHFIGHGIEGERGPQTAAVVPAFIPEYPMNMIRIRRVRDYVINAPIWQAGETGDWSEAVAEVDDVRERAHAGSPNRGVCASHHRVPGRCGASQSATEHRSRSASKASAADGYSDFGAGGM